MVDNSESSRPHVDGAGKDPAVIGRLEEVDLIDGLLADAASGRSATLVISGEPGVGKSVLLARAVQLAGSMRILRATGVQTEVDLAFAGLHQLVRPVLHMSDRLPATQANALLGALGLSTHRGEDRFLVAVATLSLLSEVAEEGPVLCVVEDAHWLDQPSTEVLAFAARRLDAEGVVMLAATRAETWRGLPGRRIERFGREDAETLLRRHAADLAPSVRDRLIEETGGNPLALVELVGSLTPAQVTGRQPLPQPLRLTGRLQDAFLDRVRLLPRSSQRLLLVAAADDTGEPAVIFRAAATLGVSWDALEAVERSGLAEIDGGRFAFRHPLVRAAVYQESTFVPRRAAHGALAGALDGEVHVERRAWHLAAAAAGADESVARELERSAGHARDRGGYAVASAAFERAAELSTTHADRARLVVAAAQAAHQAGLADRAAELADRAGPLIDDPVTADDVACLQGRIELSRGSSGVAHTLLLTAARRIAGRDPRAATAVLIEAAQAAWRMNDDARLADTAQTLVTLHLPPQDPLGALRSAAIGAGDLVAGRIPEAVARIHAGTEDWLHLVETGRATILDAWEVEAWLAMSGTTRVIGDHTSGLTLAAAAVAQCRSRGLASQLPIALANQAISEALAGRHAAAVINATEALQLARDIGQNPAICGCESVLAWVAAVRGDEDRCRELAADAIELADTHQIGSTMVLATWALGLLDLSLGHPDRALDRLLDRDRGPLLNATTRILAVPDLVEAAVRAGRGNVDPAELGGLVDRFEQWAGCTGQAWAAAATHRCRAMLTDAAADAESHLAEAARLHEQAGPQHRPFERARTQLVYGEWLRRARRRGDARIQLTAAYETFEQLGARPWADRAGTELRATGRTVQRPDSAAVRLTPQELQVVRLVAQGGSNQDVAAQLFLSPRTVAYHLYKAFPKLGIVSRADLVRIDLDALVAAH
jgi:DNA-binding CsgD family transcriptional regulator